MENSTVVFTVGNVVDPADFLQIKAAEDEVLCRKPPLLQQVKGIVNNFTRHWKSASDHNIYISFG